MPPWLKCVVCEVVFVVASLTISAVHQLSQPASVGTTSHRPKSLATKPFLTSRCHIEGGWNTSDGSATALIAR